MNRLFYYDIIFLRENEIDTIITTFRTKKEVDKFSVVVSYDDIKEKKYSLAAGQYFNVKIEYVELTQEEFNAKMNRYKSELQSLFDDSNAMQVEIMKQLGKVKYECKRNAGK